MQELSGRLDALSPGLSAALGRSATVAELAQAARCTIEQVLEARQVVTARRALSLDQPQNQDDAPAMLGDRVAIEEPGFAKAEDGVWLDELMRVLPDRDRVVVTLRFRDDMIQSEIGELLGISQMQVSRILRAAIARLQAAAAPGNDHRCESWPPGRA